MSIVRFWRRRVPSRFTAHRYATNKVYVFVDTQLRAAGSYCAMPASSLRSVVRQGCWNACVDEWRVTSVVHKWCPVWLLNAHGSGSSRCRLRMPSQLYWQLMCIWPMPTSLLIVIHVLAPFLTFLFNQLLSVGCVPVIFDVAYITTRLKKADLAMSDVKLTDPFSIYQYFRRLLERLIAKQLLSDLVEFKLSSYL